VTLRWSEISKSDSDEQKSRQFFQEKIGVTPSVAAPGDTPTIVTPLRILERIPLHSKWSGIIITDHVEPLNYRFSRWIDY